MANLTVTLVNQPADLTWWQFAVYERLDVPPPWRSVGSGMLDPNQSAQLDLPADWRFPSLIWMPTSALLIQSVGPEFGGHYDPDLLMPDFGDYTFDWALLGWGEPPPATWMDALIPIMGIVMMGVIGWPMIKQLFKKEEE